MAEETQQKGGLKPAGTETGAQRAPASVPADAPKKPPPTGASPAGGESSAMQSRAAGETAEAAAAAFKAALPQPPPASPKQPTALDEFDPRGWTVPLLCKDCNQPFAAPYRVFHAGVVFHCPSCQGSWVPNTTIARQVRTAFQDFWKARKAAREAFERRGIRFDRDQFERRQAEELQAFNERLKRMALEYRPAGKLVRRKGLRAMYT
jgi:hypothetical protein